MKKITLNIDEEALERLNAIIGVRFIGGASGPVEDMMLSILTENQNGTDTFLVALCNDKLVVEAVS